MIHEKQTDEKNQITPKCNCMYFFQTLVDIAPFPFSEVEELREKYTFNITPWSLGIGVAKKGLRILYR